MENAFDNLARAVAEVTTNLAVILPAAHLARDYHLPVRVWASPDTRTVELQRRLHNVWERAVIDGLDHNARFNHAWRQALTLAQQEHILFTSPD